MDHDLRNQRTTQKPTRERGETVNNSAKISHKQEKKYRCRRCVLKMYSVLVLFLIHKRDRGK